MTKELFIFGLRRSGNHAVINWLAGLFQSKYPNIREEAPYNGFFINNQSLPLNQFPKPPPFGIQIISFESQGAILNDESLIDPTKRIGTIKKPIIIHRDPFNWMASTQGMTSLWKTEEGFEVLVDLWIGYSKKFFIEKPNLAYTIKFNDWKDIECRKKLAEYVGEPFSDTGLNWIKGPMKGGPGSSFNYDTFDGKAQEMDLEGRWRSLDDNRRKIFDRKPELRELSKQIFNFCPF